MPTAQKIVKNLQKVFVYGTLKRGEPNHCWLTKAENGYSRFICAAKTEKKFPLVVGTRYNIPFILDKVGVGNQVHGEIYEVDSKMLANLDELEDYPDYYDREIQQIISDDGKMDCWLYILRNFPDQLLNKQHLETYHTTPELPYSERSQRDPYVKASDDLAFYADSTKADIYELNDQTEKVGA